MDIQRPIFLDEDQLPPLLAAMFLGGSSKPISLSTLALWRRKGTGPNFVRAGKSIRYPVAELRAFLNRAHGATSR